MQKYVTVVFDRKKKVEKTGKGKVELQIRLSEGKRKYVSLMDITPNQWPGICERSDVKQEIERYEGIRQAMNVLGEEPTLEVLNRHLGIISKGKPVKRRGPKPKFDLEKIKENAERIGIKMDFGEDPYPDEPEHPESFIGFVYEWFENEKIGINTRRVKGVIINILLSYGKLKKMSDLTPQGIRGFDQWLRKSGTRTDATIYGYHKRIHMYVRKAYQLGYIDRDPYDQVTIAHGRVKERQPLNEDELARLRALELEPNEELARDLFIFSAYTGLAYADMQRFDFKTMTEEHDGIYYIDGRRLKTKTKFFAPIFAPAMSVLEKYHFNLPRISYDRYNNSLHKIRDIAQLKKPLTTHVARHSFATLALTYDVPIEHVARMLGHNDISTTKIYAKSLNKTIERHAQAMAHLLK